MLMEFCQQASPILPYFAVVQLRTGYPAGYFCGTIRPGPGDMDVRMDRKF